MSNREELFLYTGNWDHITGSPGIGLYRFSPVSGAVTFLRVLDTELACGSTCLDEERDMLYIANETANLPGRHGGGGRVMGYRLNRETGELNLVCETPTLCPNPSYISLDRTRRYMVVSNHSAFGVVTTVLQDEDGNYYPQVTYDDATVDLFSVMPNGCVSQLLDVVKHYGAGKRPKQFHPHPHSAVPSPLWDLFAVCDKGNDCVYFYRLDREQDKLILCPDMPYHDIPGSSPRYCAFHPERPFFFCNHEGEHVVHAFSYTEQGELTLKATVDVLPPGWPVVKGTRYEQQGFQISANGKYLYTLVHGPKTSLVSVLRVDEESGDLELIQAFKLQGEWPRGCALSPDGRFLLVGCMMSGTIEVCAVEEKGTLTPVSVCQAQPGLSCLVLAGQKRGSEA